MAAPTYSASTLCAIVAVSAKRSFDRQVHFRNLLPRPPPLHLCAHRLFMLDSKIAVSAEGMTTLVSPRSGAIEFTCPSASKYAQCSEKRPLPTFNELRTQCLPRFRCSTCVSRHTLE